VAQGLSRADVVIRMGSERSEDGKPDLGNFSGPVLRAHLEVNGEAFAGKTVFAFAGIGRPEKFVASLQDSGAEVVGSCFFPDHHPYTEEEMVQLKAVAGQAQLVTTEKDFVRLSVADREGIRLLKAAALFDDPAALDGLLDRALSGR
jgi:tetraacyldisaccharide 4'-kinase